MSPKVALLWSECAWKGDVPIANQRTSAMAGKDLTKSPTSSSISALSHTHGAEAICIPGSEIRSAINDVKGHVLLRLVSTQSYLHLQSSRMYCYGWSCRASRGMHRCNLFEIDQGSTCPIGSLSCRRMSTESASEILYRISCLDHCWPPRPPTLAYPGACLVHTIAGLGRRELAKVGQRPS